MRVFLQNPPHLRIKYRSSQSSQQLCIFFPMTQPRFVVVDLLHQQRQDCPRLPALGAGPVDPSMIPAGGVSKCLEPCHATPSGLLTSLQISSCSPISSYFAIFRLTPAKSNLAVDMINCEETAGVVAVGIPLTTPSCSTASQIALFLVLTAPTEAIQREASRAHFLSPHRVHLHTHHHTHPLGQIADHCHIIADRRQTRQVQPHASCRGHSRTPANR